MSTLYINGDLYEDGTEFPINGAQCQEVWVNDTSTGSRVLVWINHIPPNDDPDYYDLDASDYNVGYTDITWTEDTEAIPAAKYAVYENDTLIAEDLSGSPYRRNVAGGNREYQIRAYNVKGETWSNTDMGEVWEVPSAINDFRCTPALDAVTVYFSSASGYPTVYHDLYANGTLVMANVTSGQTLVVPGGGTYTAYIIATNAAGDTQSNSCTAVIPTSGYQYFTVPGVHTFTVPAGIHEVDICGIGGGGSGVYSSIGSVITHSPGGYGGQSRSSTYTVTPGAVWSVTVGAGGPGAVGPPDSIVNGNHGGTTQFGGYIYPGGAGGNGQGYFGQGGPRSTCAGTAYDGTGDYGGQAGFGNGGNSGGHPGGVGAGGGGCWILAGCGASGAGGRGELRITWGTRAETTEMLSMTLDELRNSKYRDKEQI